MISIEFQDSKKPDKSIYCPLRLVFVRLSFSIWLREYNPDFVSRNVLASLTDKYIMGDIASLFGKMKQLEQGENYELCAMFKSMFDAMGLNEEYLRWTDNYVQRSLV